MIRHSKVARASVSSGAPPCPGSQSRPAKRSAPGGLARVTKCSCCRPRTLTPKRLARRMRDHVSEFRDGQNETSNGSSETDVNELMIRPAGSPSCAPVTNATPVAKELGGELLSDRDQARAGVGMGCEFNRHSGISYPLVMHPL